MKFHNFLKKAGILFVCCQMAINVFGQTAQTINPTGGASSLLDDGLKIVVNPTGFLSVYREDQAQYCCGWFYPNGSGGGVRLTFRFSQGGTTYSGTDLLITACATTPAEQIGNDWTTSIVGYVTSPFSGMRFNVTMNFFYTHPDKYFLVDYYVRAPYDPSYTTPETVHLYLDHDSYILGDDGSRSYRYVGVSPASEFVGDYRLSTDQGCGGGKNNPRYPSHHGFKISGSFRSYYSATWSPRNNKYADGKLYNTLSPGTCIDDGIAVEFTIGPLNLGETGVKRIMHAYGENQGEFNNINVVDPIVPPGVSSPVTVNFTATTYSEQEGNNSHPTSTIKITVGGGSLAQPQVVNFTATNGTAIQNTDYSYVKGFIIPAGVYTTPQTLTLNNITILGNELCQANRTFGVEIDTDNCNDLIVVGTPNAATFTIIDDDPISMNQPSSQTYCPGNTVPASTFSSSLPNMAYAWSATNGTAIGLPANSGTGNLPSFTVTNMGASAIAATITVTPSQTGSVCSGASAAKTYTIMVNPQPSVNLTASPLVICPGGSSTLTAAVSGGTSTPMTYTWYNGSTLLSSSTVSTYTVSATGTYSVTVRNSNGCTGTSNMVTITAGVNPSVTLAASPSTMCSGNSSTLTATVTGGVSTPMTYTWYNGSTLLTSSTVNTYSVSTTGAYSVTVRNSDGCMGTSNTATVTVIPLVTPTISVSASGNNICSGTSVTYTANITNGGSSPGYQWQINGVPVGGATASTYTYEPANGDIVTCVLTSNAACANPTTVTSTPGVTMIVTPTVVPTVTISGVPN